MRHPRLVIQILVALMHNVENKTVQELVLALRIILEIHMKVAGQNVFSTPTAHPTKHASVINAKIPAQELVDRMQIAKL
jgi:hypothetical protein